MTVPPASGRLSARTREDLLRAASRHPLASIVDRALVRIGIVAPAPVVIACSGGCDSTALLLLTAALWNRSPQGLARISVLAVDHGLRPEAADEARQVMALAEILRCGVHEIRTVDVARGCNLLDAARTARRQALACFAAEQRASHVLLGHHADDRAEGLLLALARGAGIEAAANLIPDRASEHGVRFARPLLGLRRRELRAFLEELGVPWVEDPSNRLRSRGAMRGEPALAALIDRIAEGSGNFLDDASELHALRESLSLQALPDGHDSMARDAFDALPRAVRATVVVRVVRHAGGSVPRRVVGDCLDAASSDRQPRSYRCQGGVTLTIDARSVRAERDTGAAEGAATAATTAD